MRGWGNAMPAVGALLLALAPAARAQSIAERVREVEHGTVRFSFAARPGVCGSGENNIHVRSHEEGEWEPDCEPGPVRVSLRVQAGRVTAVRTFVGGRWRPGRDVLDLGRVSSQRAADYLLALAARADEAVGKKAILPAVLADSAVVWPRLLDLARAGDGSGEVRKAAMFWLGHEVGQRAVAGLPSAAREDEGDISVQESAVFALSQRPRDEGVPALVRVARSAPHAKLRKSAIFWLGQSGDPRALHFFEEVLGRR